MVGLRFFLLSSARKIGTDIEGVTSDLVTGDGSSSHLGTSLIHHCNTTTHLMFLHNRKLDNKSFVVIIEDQYVPSAFGGNYRCPVIHAAPATIILSLTSFTKELRLRQCLP